MDFHRFTPSKNRPNTNHPKIGAKRAAPNLRSTGPYNVKVAMERRCAFADRCGRARPHFAPRLLSDNQLENLVATEFIFGITLDHARKCKRIADAAIGDIIGDRKHVSELEALSKLSSRTARWTV
jgi:hypothetical protein